MSALGTSGLLSALLDHARRTGEFVAVLSHEPKAAPAARGVTYAIWADPISPLRSSGLNSTSVLVNFTGRLYRSMFGEQEDDLGILRALDALMAEYAADFTLGGSVRAIDLLGSESSGLTATPGYLEMDHKLFRTVDLTIPLIANDLWTQAP